MNKHKQVRNEIDRSIEGEREGEKGTLQYSKEKYNERSILKSITGNN